MQKLAERVCGNSFARAARSRGKRQRIRTVVATEDMTILPMR
jgi:hypothetical protein